MSSTQQDRRPARRPALWQRLLLLLGSLLVTAGIVELGLRIVGVKPRTATVLKCFFQQNPSSGWRGSPGISYRLAAATYDVVINHDADGLRCCGLPTRIDDDAKDSGTVTWCVGDSFTWGLGVRDAATWVALLNQRGGPAERFRNLGVSAFSSVQEYLFLKEQFTLGRRPSQVILLFCINDLEENLNDNGGCPPRPFVELVDGSAVIRNYPVPPSPSWSAAAWFKTHLLTYNYLHYFGTRAIGALRSWNDARTQVAPPPGPVAVAQPVLTEQQQTEMARQWLALEKVYAMTKRLCEEQGVRLAVAVELEGDIGDGVAQVCRRLSIPLLDLRKRLREYVAAGGDPEKLKLEADPHYNELGHRLLAEAIHDELQHLPKPAPAVAHGAAKSTLR